MPCLTELFFNIIYLSSGQGVFTLGGKLPKPWYLTPPPPPPPLPEPFPFREKQIMINIMNIQMTVQ